MSNTSSNHDRSGKNTSSGQGALGMGGQPSDDPRDEAGGGDGGSLNDEFADDKSVPGAFGSEAGSQKDARSANTQAVGPPSGPGNVPDVKAALDKSGPVSSD